MQVWAALEFAFLLAVAAGIFGLIISKLRIIERAEEQEWLEEVKEKIATTR